jgi:hypothetical protein
VEVAHRFAHYETQFNLVVHVHATRTKNGTSAWEEDRRWGLEEEEGLFWAGAVQFFDVVADRVNRAWLSDLSEWTYA